MSGDRPLGLPVRPVRASSLHANAHRCKRTVYCARTAKRDCVTDHTVHLRGTEGVGSGKFTKAVNRSSVGAPANHRAGGVGGGVCVCVGGCGLGAGKCRKEDSRLSGPDQERAAQIKKQEQGCVLTSGHTHTHTHRGKMQNYTYIQSNVYWAVSTTAGELMLSVCRRR